MTVVARRSCGNVVFGPDRTPWHGGDSQAATLARIQPNCRQDVLPVGGIVTAPVGPPDPREVPRFAGVATYARLPRIEDVPRADVAVLGVPFDSGTSFRPGARFGPEAVRAGSRRCARTTSRSTSSRGRRCRWPMRAMCRPIRSTSSRRSARSRTPRMPFTVRRNASSRSVATTPSRCAPAAGRACPARPDRARAFRRPPRHLGHLFRRPLHAWHPVPAGVRGGAARTRPLRARRHPQFRVRPVGPDR